MRCSAALIAFGLFALPMDVLAAQSDSASRLEWPRPASGVQLLPGLHYSSATGPFATIGLGVRGQWTRHGWAGPFIALEPGARGGRVSVGAGSVYGPSAHSMQLRITGIRSWARSSSLTQGTSYLGPEYRMTLFFLSGGVGRYWRFGGPAHSRAAVYAATFGVAF